MEPYSRHLALHAVIVLVIGLLCNIPYSQAVERDAPPQAIRSWQLAHFLLPIGATLMFAVAALLESLDVGTLTKWLITASLIVAAYAFVMAAPLAALLAQRSPAERSVGLARLARIGRRTGAAFSVLAALLLAYAGFASR